MFEIDKKIRNFYFRTQKRKRLYPEGTSMHSEVVLAFYKQIKTTCPETVFHGTDVGHQYNTTGARYLDYLKNNGLKNSSAYRQTQETYFLTTTILLP